MSARVRPYEARDFTRAAESLASAFADDPIVTWTLRPDPRTNTLVEGMQNNLRVFTPHALTFVDDEVNGAALWAHHARWRLPLWRELLLLPAMLRFTSVSRLGRLQSGFDEMKRRHPHEPHYYLFQIGVRAEAQGRGLGRALMQPMLERCDTEGLAAYLESSKEANVPFYRALGFELRETFPFGPGGPQLFPMWRAPQRGAPALEVL